MSRRFLAFAADLDRIVLSLGDQHAKDLMPEYGHRPIQLDGWNFPALFLFSPLIILLAKHLYLVLVSHQIYHILYPLSFGNVQHIGAGRLNRV